MLPALSVAEQDTDLEPPTPLVSTSSHEAEAIPERLSLAFGEAVALPFSRTGLGDTLGLSVGLVASRLIVTDFEAVPPALVASQVSVVPAVSALIVVESQPLVEEIADSLSTTVHETVTLLVYQSLLPRVPLTLGEMTGGVVSDGPVT